MRAFDVILGGCGNPNYMSCLISESNSTIVIRLDSEVGKDLRLIIRIPQRPPNHINYWTIRCNTQQNKRPHDSPAIGDCGLGCPPYYVSQRSRPIMSPLFKHCHQPFDLAYNSISLAAREGLRSERPNAITIRAPARTFTHMFRRFLASDAVSTPCWPSNSWIISGEDRTSADRWRHLSDMTGN